jgi:hypothetical protein
MLLIDSLVLEVGDEEQLDGRLKSVAASSWVRFRTRVARWYIFRPKIPIVVCIFWKTLEWKILIYFMDLWYFLSCLLNCIAVCYFLPFWYVVRIIIWQPWHEPTAQRSQSYDCCICNTSTGVVVGNVMRKTRTHS